MSGHLALFAALCICLKFFFEHFVTEPITADLKPSRGSLTRDFLLSCASSPIAQQRPADLSLDRTEDWVQAIVLVNVSIGLRANGCNLCWPTIPNFVGCYMLCSFAHPVACCWMLLRVVAQSLKPVKLFATCKRTQHCWLTTPNIAGSRLALNPGLKFCSLFVFNFQRTA